MNRALTKFGQLNQILTFVRFNTAKAANKKADDKSEKVVAHEKHIRYNPYQAIRLLKAYSHCSFDETVDLCVHLNVNPKIGDQIVRGTAVMPAGTRKGVVVAVLCPPEYASILKEAGADLLDTPVIMEQVR